jgi:uncharacterized protein YbjQ (UPF0145 family)
MSVQTSGQYDASVWRPVRFVYATNTQAVSLLRGMATGFLSAFGGQQDMLDKKQRDAIEGAMKSIRENIGEGQCIVGLNLSISQFARQDQDPTITAVASGTLLTKKAQEGGGKRTTKKNKRR